MKTWTKMDGWVTGDRSDILIDEAMQRAQVDAGRRYNGDHNKSVSRFILQPKLNNPIPRTGQSLDLKLARKITKRSKRDLRGLWETLAPGSTVVRTSNTTTVIKEPGVPEVSVRNSDIAKFGTRVHLRTATFLKPWRLENPENPKQGVNVLVLHLPR